MRFQGCYRPDVAYRWHRIAVDSADDPRVGAAYRRKDSALRKAAKAADDETWIAKRASMGEEATLTEMARSAAEVLNGLDWPAPANTAAELEVQCVSPMRLAWWTQGPGGAIQGICLGPHSTPELMVAAAHAHQDWETLLELPLLEADRYLLALHLGATRILKTGLTTEQTDRLLTTVGTALLPLRGREEAARAFLHRVAKACLDQPYGEIERIASGFHSARTDRVHRAWERGFFVPRGLTIIARDEQPC